MTIEKGWLQLWRKAYETKDFIPQLNELIIHEKSDDHVLRTMSLGPMVIKEDITCDRAEGIVYFKNIEGSHLKGLIINQIKQTEDGCILVFKSSARTENGDPAPPSAMFQQACNTTRELIEKFSWSLSEG